MMKKITVTGCVLWIAGLAASIAGLNLTGDTGKWLSICGNIVFLAGLGITGAVWFKKKKTEENSKAEEKEQRD